MDILLLYGFICLIAIVGGWYVTWYDRKSQHSEEPNL